MATVQTLVISTLIFTTLFTGGIFVFSDFVEVYSLTPNANFGNVTNATDHLQTLYNRSNELHTSFTASNSELTSADAGIVGGFNALKTTLNIPETLKATFVYIAATIGIPTFILTSVMAGITFIFVLAVIGAFLGRRL